MNTKEYGQAGSTTLCSLLKYIANGTVGSDKLTKRLDELVEQINEDKRWVSGVWKGLTWEESNRIALNSTKRECERRVKEAEAAAEAALEAEVKANNKLTSSLLDQNRVDDLKRCTQDPEFKQQVMEELGIL